MPDGRHPSLSAPRLRWAIVSVLALALGSRAGVRADDHLRFIWTRADDGSATRPRFDPFGDPLPEGAVARLGTLRLRHPNAHQVRFSPDGLSFFTWGTDGTVRFWDAASGNRIETRRLPYTSTRLDRISPDGNLYLAQPEDALKVWDLRAGTCIRRLALRDVTAFSAAAFSPDGRFLATADDTPREYRVRLWDLATGVSQVVDAHDGRVNELVFTPNGRRLVAACSEQALVCCYTVSRAMEVWRIETECDRVSLSADGKTLVTWRPGTSNRPPGLWDAATGKELAVAARPEPRSFTTVEVSPDGKTLLLASGAGSELWDVEAGRVIRELPQQFESPTAFSPDCGSLVSVRGAGVVQRYDIRTGKPLYPEPGRWGHTGIVSSLTWSGDGCWLATRDLGSKDSTRLWDPVTGALILTRSTAGSASSSIAFGSDSRRLFVEDSVVGDVESLDLRTHEKTWRYRPSFSALLLGFAAHPDQAVVVLLHGGLNLKGVAVTCVDARFGKRLSGWYDFNLEWPCVLSRNGRFLVAGVRRVLETATGKEWPTLDSVNGDVPCGPFEFSPDGSLMAVGFQQGKSNAANEAETRVVNVGVWERATGRPLRQLPTGPAGLYAFLPDNRTLAITGPDGLHLWDIRQGKETFFRKAHDPGAGFRSDTFASALAISPDGRRAATGHVDTTVLIWDLPTPTPQRPRTLADAEIAALWATLAEPDPARAYPALWRLAESPAQAVAFLRDRLRPVRMRTAAELRANLDDLDADSFRRREAATRRLAALGDAARDALAAAARGDGSPEARRRAKILLDGLEWKVPPRGEDLRYIRAVGLLGQVGTSDARDLLEQLAGGEPSARVTVEARAALARLRRLDCN